MAKVKVAGRLRGYNLVDITGQRFERLVVIERDHSRSTLRTWWLCQCDCGSQTTVDGWKLKHGLAKSCGCYRGDHLRAIRKTHGLSDRIPEYFIWLNMRSRCNNKNNKHYKDYGGRGIKVCDRWQRNFDLFLGDMGCRPAPEYSIDRILNDGNYEPGNCQWATPAQQARNKRKNVHLLVDGKDKILAEAARDLGLSPGTVSSRIKRGLPPERVFVSGDLRCRMLEWNGAVKNIKEWTKEFGLTYQTVIRRLGYGWTDPEEILFGRKKRSVA